jgi:hypothetical protein
MDRRRLALTAGTMASLAFAAVVVAATGPGADGASSSTLSIDIGAMTYHDDATQDSVCGAFSPSENREFEGTEGGRGTYIASVNLPQGARVTALRLTARDNDADFDTHAYLVRKRMAPKAGVDGFGGYGVLAQATSIGSSTALRRFSVSAISAPVIDNASFAYMAEIVNCVDTVDPIGVQIAWTKG